MIENEQETLTPLEAFALGCKPADELGVVAYCEKYVSLANSAINPRFTIEATNYLREPMEAMADDDVREVWISAAVGGGKTTMLEAFNQYAISEEPGNMMLATQNVAESKRWMETRFLPSLKMNEKIVPLLPSGKNKRKIRMEEIVFAHMFFQIGGANKNFVQSKSCRWVELDEVWTFPQGIVEDARMRTHDRANSCIIGVSQAGYVGDDFDVAISESLRHEYGFDCPCCGDWQAYDWGQMKYEDIKDDESGERIWDKTRESVYYECRHCEERIEDNVKNRRQLSSNGSYQCEGNQHKTARKAYTFSAMAVWRVSWAKLVEEYLTAQDEEKKGNWEPMAQFVQKRLSKSWEEPVESVQLGEQGEAYSLEEYWDGAEVDGELSRFLTIDVQQDHFWAVIRAWRGDGSSRLLYAGKLQTWDALRQLQGRFKVQNKCVLVDRGYKKDDVAEASMAAMHQDDKFPWLPTLGEEADEGYLTTRGRYKFKLPYSQLYTAITLNGLRYRYIKFSNLLAKDMLARYMSGHAAPWETPIDIGDDYKIQVQNEAKEEIRPGKYRYNIVKKHLGNHLFDCEVLQIVGASLMRIINAKSKVDEEATNA